MFKHNYQYGYFKDLKSLVEQVDIVCETLDSDAVFTKSRLMVLETLAQETKLGLISDSTKRAGMGIAQFDRIGFRDTRHRCLYSSHNYYETIKDAFNINIGLVEWKSLRYNPFLSILFCRLKYKLVPEPIPATIQDRWLYYKQHFNSYEGKAKKKEYIENAEYVKQLLSKLS